MSPCVNGYISHDFFLFLQFRLTRYRYLSDMSDSQTWSFYLIINMHILLGEVPPILVPQKKTQKKQKTKKQKTKKQTTISALVIFYLLCQELIFNGSVSFIIYTLFKLFFYQFINKKNWIVSKLSLSTKARQTFCFKTPSLLPQVAISVHIPKI